MATLTQNPEVKTLRNGKAASCLLHREMISSYTVTPSCQVQHSIFLFGLSIKIMHFPAPYHNPSTAECLTEYLNTKQSVKPNFKCQLCCVQHFGLLCCWAPQVQWPPLKTHYNKDPQGHYVKRNGLVYVWVSPFFLFRAKYSQTVLCLPLLSYSPISFISMGLKPNIYLNYTPIEKCCQKIDRFMTYLDNL